MYQTQQALISHLESFGGSAKTIKEYAGEFQGTSRQGVDYPAIFVLYREGAALQQLPDLQYELFFVAKNDHHDNEKAKQSALELAEPYCDFLTNNHHFDDTESYYAIKDVESANLTTLMNNHRWCILLLRNVTVNVDRQI